MDNKLCPTCDEYMIDKQRPCPLSCMSKKCKSYQKTTIIDTSQKPVVWVMGGPSVGKSVQCQNISRKYGLVHLAPDELMRAEANSDSERATCLKSIMKRGGQIPNDIVLALHKEEIARKADSAKGFVVDGFPIEKSQGMAFEEAVGAVSAIIFIHASRDVLLQRLKAVTPPDQLDEGDLEKRIKAFREANLLVQAHYKHKVKTVSGEGAADSVFSEIQKILDPVMEAAAKAASSAKS